MSAFYSDLDAALGLTAALADMDRIAKEKATYEWGWTPPPSLLDAEHDAADRIRSAIRHFSEEDEATA